MASKTVEFRVLVSVDDSGQMDEGVMRDAIHQGLDIAMQEGNLTSLDDETTVIEGYTVSHVGTK